MNGSGVNVIFIFIGSQVDNTTGKSCRFHKFPAKSATSDICYLQIIVVIACIGTGRNTEDPVIVAGRIHEGRVCIYTIGWRNRTNNIACSV